ncbi:MAG: transporter substrate-binding domain-containing protein [Pseudomonadota bacterium]
MRRPGMGGGMLAQNAAASLINRFRWHLLVWALCVAMPAPATSQQVGGLSCGVFYRIEPGDTLRAITIRTYGHDRFRVLFRANRDILNNPAQIEIGQLIYLPCAASGPQGRRDALLQANRKPTTVDQVGARRARTNTAADLPVTALRGDARSAARGAGAGSAEARTGAEAQIDAPPPPDERKAGRDSVLLTASGLAPLAERSLPAGGLVSALIDAALHAAEPGHAVRTVFVDDRRAHLETLLAMDGFDLGFPWPTPRCPAPADAPSSARMCRDFLFSRPIFELEMAVVVRRGDPLARAASLQSAHGRVVCRPSDLPPVDLESSGVRIGIIEAPDLEGCLDMLRAGQADLISAPAAAIAGALTQDVALAPALGRPIPVHAIAWRQAPGAEALIDRLNRGLRRLQRSGAWFKTVSDYLSDYNARLASRG